ncbi:MAG: DUF2059 domain-containing protein [Prevotellaceae bacterium]|jgi:hypothetical protein|nr:DUF2059 domain-containing protein [Prevotellaceae bacterium]
MKKLLLLSALIAAFAMSAMAQDKASDVKKLLQLTSSEKMISGIFDNIIPAMKQQASTQIKGVDSKEKLDKYVEFMMTELKGITIKMANEEMLKSYDKAFTHEEIKDMIKFYESPTGKKMLAKTPELSADMMNAMMTKYMPAFQEKMTKKLEELK